MPARRMSAHPLRGAGHMLTSSLHGELGQQVRLVHDLEFWSNFMKFIDQTSMILMKINMESISLVAPVKLRQMYRAATKKSRFAGAGA